MAYSDTGSNLGGNYSNGYGQMFVYDQFTDENRVNVTEEIYRKWNATNFPLQAMLSTGTVDNYHFDIRKSNHIAQEYTSTAASSVATSITFSHNTSDAFGEVTTAVTSSTYLQAGTLLLNKETMDIVRVTTKVAADQPATVVRVAGANAVTASDTWIKIGSAQNEGADIGEIVLPSMDRDWNYTQITRVPYGLTGTQMASATNYGSELARQRHDSLFEHKLRKEMALWWGERGSDQTAGSGIRVTRGIMRWICGGVLGTANSEDIAGNLTESALFSALKTAMVRSNKPNQNWTAFCSATALFAINSFAHDRIQTEPGSINEYGMNVKNLVTPFGSCKLVHNPFFNTADDRTADGSGYGIGNGIMALVDLDKFKVVTLGNRSFQVLKNRQGNGEDGYKEETLEEWGLKPEGFDLGYTFYGITG